MTWNYRIIEKDEDGRLYYQIYEVYYDEFGQPEMWTEQPCTPLGDTAEDLDANIHMMQLAYEKPTLQIVDGKLVEMIVRETYAQP